MTVVCIAGMHRSGTSMVSRMLNLCGVYLGQDNELLPANFDNPEGFWENINFIEINEKILSKFKGSWDNPPVFEPGWETSPLLDDIRLEAEKLVQAMNSRPVWGWKDPRTSITFPFWSNLIPDLKVIVCVRNPLEVAQSLEDRNNFPTGSSLELWRKYNDMLISAPRLENCIFTHYQSYFFDPQAELARILQLIGIPANSLAIDNACKRATPHLRHNISSLFELVEILADAQTSMNIARLYAKMCGYAGPIYLNYLRKKLPLEQEMLTNVIELGLLERLQHNDSTVQMLVELIIEKNQEIQSHGLIVNDLQRELEAHSADLRIYTNLVGGIPTRVLKIYALLWKMFNDLFPLNSVRRRLVRRIESGLVKSYKARKETRGEYQLWVNTFDIRGPRKRQAVISRIENFIEKPLLSILMPVYNPPLNFLNEAINSVRSQSYENWELCLADDHSPNPQVRRLIEKHMKEEPRIRCIFRTTNGHISESSNSALELAAGKYLVLLDHDDILHPHALYFVADEINKYPDVEVIYSDEDKFDEAGVRTNPYFKPDFDYDLLLSQNMVSHLGVYKTETVRRIGGFRTGFEGSQDYDLILRMVEVIEPGQIRHIPRVLYHWRVSEQSVAAGASAKPYAYLAAEKAIREHLARRKINASVRFIAELSSYDVNFKPPHLPPTVDVMISGQLSLENIEKCVNLVLYKAKYPNHKILCFVTDRTDSKEEALYERWEERFGISIIRNPDHLPHTRRLNQAIESSSAEFICLLNGNIVDATTHWLSRLIGLACQTGIGAISPIILSANRDIVHSGIILKPDDIFSHLFSGLRKGTGDYFGWSMIQRGFTALSGACLTINRARFLEMGGFKNELSSYYYSILDLCLELRKRGYRNIMAPAVELYISSDVAYNDGVAWLEDMKHSPHSELDEKYMIDRWQDWINHDPAFSPNLEIKKGEIILAWPPRGDIIWDTDPA